jgi:hypothetical protein
VLCAIVVAACFFLLHFLHLGYAFFVLFSCAC